MATENNDPAAAAEVDVEVDLFGGLDIDDLDTEETRRRCNFCGEWKPVTSFRLRDGGTYRSRRCNMCDKNSKKLNKNVARQEEIRRGVHRLIGAARGSQYDVPKIERMAHELVREFGGVEEFIAELVSTVRETTGKIRIDGLMGCFKIIQSANQEKREDLDMARYTEEELEEAIRGYVLRVVGPEQFDDDGEEVCGDETAGGSEAIGESA